MGASDGNESMMEMLLAWGAGINHKIIEIEKLLLKIDIIAKTVPTICTTTHDKNLYLLEKTEFMKPFASLTTFCYYEINKAKVRCTR